MTTPEANPQPGDDRIMVVCLHCEKSQPVSRRAISLTCKYCSKSLRIEDIRVKDYHARRTIETVGVFTIEKKGQVLSDSIQCGGLIVRGKLKGEVVCRGPVLVGPEAEIRGNVTAPRLAVGAGAVLEGRYKIGLSAPHQNPEGALSSGG
jgi:hypothetical protein